MIKLKWRCARQVAAARMPTTDRPTSAPGLTRPRACARAGGREGQAGGRGRASTAGRCLEHAVCASSTPLYSREYPVRIGIGPGFLLLRRCYDSEMTLVGTGLANKRSSKKASLIETADGAANGTAATRTNEQPTNQGATTRTNKRTNKQTNTPTSAGAIDGYPHAAVPCRDRPLPCAGRRHAGSGARRVGKPIFRRMPTDATIAEARPPKKTAQGCATSAPGLGTVLSSHTMLSIASPGADVAERRRMEIMISMRL